MREPKPMIHVEVSEKNRTLRIVVAVILLVIGVVAITSGIKAFFSKDTGWQDVQISTRERNCSDDFLLRYHFSGTAAEATSTNRKLEQVYTEACIKAYRLFTPDEGFENVQNVYYVNHHPNQMITVDPLLYAAFEKTQDTPWLYLGPVYNHYYHLIFSEDSMVADLDPASSDETAAFLSQIAAFADGDIHLELLGGNQIRLNVSEAYLAFAQQEEIENFIDFAYLTNGFIIDYLADILTEQGLTDCYLVSVDGYTRNLDGNNRFKFNLYHRVDRAVYPTGVMEYQGPVSIVYLKNYTTAPSDTRYRVVGDHMVHLYADPIDGVYRTGTADLVSYSYDSGCADVVLKMLSSFVGDTFSVPHGVFSIWHQDNTIFYQDDRISISNLLEGENAYQAVRVK